ncbi:MAG: hypothetical protein AAF465_14415 [Pseudomonadota bacterium]
MNALSNYLITGAAILLSLSGCATADLSDEYFETAARQLDYGDYSSAYLLEKAWDAYKKKDYAKILGYTTKCVDIHGDEGKRMNSTLSAFEPEVSAGELWALNDVGTCLYIMANTYEELQRYPDAVRTYRQLATDYTYAQCWDTKGWFWRPAEGAARKAEKMKNW